MRIGSIHGAKGLEWPFVALGGLAGGQFPSRRSTSDDEEERRLAYVAMTRAREHLVLLHPEDPELVVARDANAPFDRDAHHVASIYVHDAAVDELGAIAAALSAGPPPTIVRAPRASGIVRRYLAAAGRADVTVLGPDERPALTRQHAAPGVRVRTRSGAEGTLVEICDERHVVVRLDAGTDVALRIAHLTLA